MGLMKHILELMATMKIMKIFMLKVLDTLMVKVMFKQILKTKENSTNGHLINTQENFTTYYMASKENQLCQK